MAVRLLVDYNGGVTGSGVGPPGLPGVEWGGSHDGTPPLKDQLAFVPDPLGQRAGLVARVTVGPGHRMAAWDNGERCLMKENYATRVEAPRPGDVRWYRWSQLIPTGWQQPMSHAYPWAYVFEMHPADQRIPQASPKVGIRNGKIRLYVSGGPLSSNGQDGTFVHGGPLQPEHDLPILNLGQWDDFILGVGYSALAFDGWMELWHRPSGQPEFVCAARVTGRNLIHLAGQPPPAQYLEHGFYRNPEPFTNVLCLDNFAVGDTMADVLGAFPNPDPCVQLRAELDAANAKIALALEALR